MPYHELDALHHGPNWVPRPEFAADVAAFAATDTWVTEWQYRAVRPLLLARADLLVWLDLTRLQVARGLLPRTVVRRVRRVELWNGNVERPLWTIFTDPEHVVRWAWYTHARTAARVHEVAAAPDGPVVVRLRGRSDTRDWLATISP